MVVTAHSHKMTRLDVGPPKELYCEVEGCDYREKVPDRPELHAVAPDVPRERPGAPQTPGAPKPTAPTGGKKHVPMPPSGRPLQLDDDDL